MRSFLFVPGDSPRKFESAKKTAADALILDLEDSIAPEEKVGARRTVRDMLGARNPRQRIYIRVNALDTGMTLGDLAAAMPGRPDGIVLPKCAGAADVNRLSLYLDAFEAAVLALPDDAIRVLALVDLAIFDRGLGFHLEVELKLGLAVFDGDAGDGAGDFLVVVRDGLHVFADEARRAGDVLAQED